MSIFEDMTRGHPGQEQNVNYTQPYPTVTGHLRHIGDVIDANPLVSRLLDTGAGRYLSPADTEHVIAIVAAIEETRMQQMQQQPAGDGPSQHPVDATPFPVAGPQPVRQ